MGFPRQEYWSELLFPSPALSFLSDAKKLKVLFLDKTGFSEKMMFLLNLEKQSRTSNSPVQLPCNQYQPIPGQEDTTP